MLFDNEPNSLLARLFDHDLQIQEAAIAEMECTPFAVARLEPQLRGALTDDNLFHRVCAAFILARLSRDKTSGEAVLRHARPQLDTSPQEREAIGTRVGLFLRHLPDRGAALLREAWVWWPEVREFLPADVVEDLGRNWLRANEAGFEVWRRAVDAPNDRTTELLFMSLAEVVPALPYDVTVAVERLRVGLASPITARAAGAALWRITWRVNQDWITHTTQSLTEENTDPELIRILVDVLIEHLGRRPDLAASVVQFLSALHDKMPEEVPPRVANLVRGGAPGWSVLLLAVGQRERLLELKLEIYKQSLGSPGLLRLMHTHAHRVIKDRLDRPADVDIDLVESACLVLKTLGSTAESALTDLLELAVKDSNLAVEVSSAAVAVVSDNPRAAMLFLSALDGMREQRHVRYRSDRSAFAILAGWLYTLQPDLPLKLVEDAGTEIGLLHAVLADSAWRDAPAEIRARHLNILADRLSSPRETVRGRAAFLLRHYLPELPTVWPALVAALTSSEIGPVSAVLMYYRVLSPAVDTIVPELTELLHDTNPMYAARAVFALWRLGKFPEFHDSIRAVLMVDHVGNLATANLRQVVHDVAPRRGCIANQDEITNHLLTTCNPPASEEDRHWLSLLPRLDDPQAPQIPDWAGIDRLIANDPTGLLLYLAVMAEHGLEGMPNKKIQLIKCCREFTGSGLGEAKSNVETAMSDFTRPAPRESQRRGIRAFFGGRSEVPEYLRILVDDHRAWYRWAGLVLIDGWFPFAPDLQALVEERLYDPSRFVGVRAMRMTQE